MQTRHHIISYKGPHNHSEGLCGVSIFQASSDIAVVVFTEFQQNPGTSVTNAVDVIASRVRRAFISSVSPENIIWVERYEAADRAQDLQSETFDLVGLSWTGNEYAAPHWRPVGRDRSAADFWRVLFQSDKPLAEFPRFSDIGAVRLNEQPRRHDVGSEGQREHDRRIGGDAHGQ